MPTGQVIFEFIKKHGKKLKVTTLGTAALSGGAATLTFKPNKVLNQPLTIVYSGDPDFLASKMSPPKLTKSELASSSRRSLSPHRSIREAAVKRECLTNLEQLVTGGWHHELQERSFWEPVHREGQRDPRLLARRRSIQAPAQEGLSHAEDPALSRRLKRIDQDKLLLGDYTLREVIENGRHLFTTPFTKAEGYGEGGKPDGAGGFLIGPREVTFRQNLDAFRVQTKSGLSNDQLRQFLNFPVPEVNPNTHKIVYPYVRLNGLDSQRLLGVPQLHRHRAFARHPKPMGSHGNRVLRRRGGIRRQRVH